MKKHFRLTPLTGVFVLISFICSNVSAQTLPTISYQGVLENNGAAVNGTDTLKILIYSSETGGTPLYTETQSADVVNGVFNISIGSVTPLLPALDFTKQYYLAISVNGGSELSPRSLVSFAPYAFRALYADTAIYATKANVANTVSGGAVNSVNGETGTLTLSGNNGITVSNSPPNIIISSTGVQSVNTAGGKLTLVGAGGTTITDTGSVLTIRSATFTGGTGIQAVQNTDNSIAVTNGSGPIATLGLAQQNASTGQILAWNGSSWRPASTPFIGITNSDSTLTITNPNGPVATVGMSKQNASAGQILVWNGSAWRPETVSGVGADSIKNLGDARVDPPPIGNLFLGAGAGTHDTTINSIRPAANTAIGIQAMDSNKTGGGNTAIGCQALYVNISGGDNTATGTFALNSNMNGNSNTATGYEALYTNITGSNNCAFGYGSGGGGGGSFNTAIGSGALSNDTGWNNVAIGVLAMKEAGAGFSRGVSHIVAIGDSALMQDAYFYNNGGDSTIENTAIGSGSLRWTVSGAYNTATGFQALHQNVSGYHNTANGASALWNDSGSNNTGIGYLALYQNTSGSNNTAVGDSAGTTSSNLSNTTCLGSGATTSTSNSVVLGNASVQSLYCQGAYFATTANSANMVVTSTGQIMRSTSSARYKTNIHDLDINTDKLYDLRPVSYTSKIDGKEYFGLVAEDVAKVLPDLAEYARAKDVIPGSTSEEMIPDAVKYPMLSVLLLDELKKEHAKVETEEMQVESQGKIIADMERRLEALEASQKNGR